MTDKTKMSNLESYTELSIQIATIDMKLDAILKLLNKPDFDVEVSELDITPIKIILAPIEVDGVSDEEQWRWEFK